MSNYNSIEEFNGALQFAKDNMAAVLVPSAKIALNNMAGAIRLRVSSTGQTSEGGQFSAYSNKYKPVKTKRGKAPFGKIINKKNFYFQGTMWDSLQVSNISSTKDNIHARVDFIGNNVYKSNRELNEIHSTNEFGSDEKKGIGYPTFNEEVQMVAELETKLFVFLESMI